MSKVTVVTDQHGKILAIGLGHLSEATAKKNRLKGNQAGLRAFGGQQLHELDLTDNLEHLKTFKELRDKIRPHVRVK
jgi:hypothetical protein